MLGARLLALSLLSSLLFAVSCVPSPGKLGGQSDAAVTTDTSLSDGTADASTDLGADDDARADFGADGEAPVVASDLLADAGD
ncbi:MAG: hypothetical protein KC609_13435, partial [Myxococcales bacterium]|nr:hypothetical protein [Myxococcales bacterium]